MIFNSVTFLVFLLLVVVLYWVLPQRARLWMVFLSSITFYGFWRVEFVPVMLASAITDFYVAQKIDASSTQRRKTRLLLVSLFVNLGLLAYFKYLLFFASNVVSVAAMLGVEIDPITWNIILPLGISFYTFQTISYSVDVYRGFIKPEHDFVLYGCYVTFFPQLVAGPVLRAREVIPQLVQRSAFSLDNLAIGGRRILYGLFLKVVFADNIAPFVDDGFAAPVAALSALDVWTLAFLFGLQIYFDFSAYSHIALGAARLMGITFPENFNFPYSATSPRDFWKRWHISLSSWIRDYLYLPLTGAQVHDRSTGGLATATRAVAASKTTQALFLTWAIMGLWHGANWTFVLWGVYHAVFIYAYRAITPYTKTLPQLIQRWGGWLLTLPIVMLSWIFFRADSVEASLAMYHKLLIPDAYPFFGLSSNTYIVAALLMFATLVGYVLHSRLIPWLQQKARPLYFCAETVVFTVAIALVFIFLRPIQQFIYFQF